MSRRAAGKGCSAKARAAVACRNPGLSARGNGVYSRAGCGAGRKCERRDNSIISSLPSEKPSHSQVDRRQPEPANRLKWAALCFTINCLYAVYLAGLGVILEPIGRSFGLGSAAQARLFPASFTGTIVSVLACGFLSDRFGRLRVIQISAAVFAAGLAVFAKAPGFGVALAAAPFIGAGSGAMQTVANALIADLFVDRQKVMVNAAQIAFGVGAVCGPLAASGAMAAGLDWRTLYVVLSAVVLGLLLLTSAAPGLPARAPSIGTGLTLSRTIAREPAFLNLCLVAALYAGAEVGFFQWMPSYFHLRLQDGGRWAGIIVSIFWLGMTVGRIAGGSLISNFRLIPLRSALAAAGGLFALATLAFPWPWPTIAFVTLTGLSFGCIFSLVLAEAAERYPMATGTVFGVVVAISGIGTAAIPWAIGALAGTSVGWQGGLCLVPLCAFAVAASGIRDGRARIAPARR